jgi:hypothetical protein
MTVTCLDKNSQQAIVTGFNNGTPIDTLSAFWGRSRRTIIRVLEEHDVDPMIRRRNPKPALAFQHSMPYHSQIPGRLITAADRETAHDHKVLNSAVQRHLATNGIAFSHYPGQKLINPTPDRFTTPWYRRLGAIVCQFFHQRSTA